MMDLGKIRNRRFLVPGLIACLVALASLAAFAAGGSGGGSGGGSNETLALVSSEPAAEAKDVALQPEIKLTFNKNVVNFAVTENNLKCFKLFAATDEETEIPIEVIMADDQITPELKEVIVVKPAKPLLPGTAYVLRIAKELQAKNGTLLGKAVELRFTTVAATVSCCGG